MGARGLRRRHASHALGQHQSQLHRDGRRRLADLPRRHGSPAERDPARPPRRPRGHEIRGLEKVERRVRQTIRQEQLMSRWIRQFHRWIAIAFTLTVVANFVAMAKGPPPAWITYSPLLPLALL